jgi:hypothetical protein
MNHASCQDHEARGLCRVAVSLRHAHIGRGTVGCLLPQAPANLPAHVHLDQRETASSPVRRAVEISPEYKRGAVFDGADGRSCVDRDPSTRHLTKAVALLQTWR